MAYLWAWDDDPDPMIDRPVGLRQPNESTDVFLVQALLVAIYEKRSQRPLQVLPIIGTRWGDTEDAFVADFQANFVKQRVPTRIVSPPPPSMHYRTAVAKKYTMAHLIQGARISASYYYDATLVSYLVWRAPILKGPLSVIRNREGVMPVAGTSEDFFGGGTVTNTSGQL